MLPTVQLKNMGSKICKKCNAEKPLTNFYKCSPIHDWYSRTCNQCVSKKYKEWYQKNRPLADTRSKAYYLKNKESRDDHYRNWGLKKQFGITLNDYNRMFQIQGGMCAICKRHQSRVNKALRVDHCHVTKKVRGLLCHNCNVSLGLLKDSVTTIKSMVEYLEKQ